MGPELSESMVEGSEAVEESVPVSERGDDKAAGDWGSSSPPGIPSAAPPEENIG